MERSYNAKMRDAYELAISGREAYRLLQILEEVAIEERNYMKVADCVRLAEALRERLNKQGWGRDIPKSLLDEQDPGRG